MVRPEHPELQRRQAASRSAGCAAGTRLTIAASQLPKLLGIPSPPAGSGFFATEGHSVAHLGETNGETVVFAIAAILLLLLIARFVPRIPGALIVVAGIVLVALAGLAQASVALIAAGLGDASAHQTP